MNLSLEDLDYRIELTTNLIRYLMLDLEELERDREKKVVEIKETHQ